MASNESVEPPDDQSTEQKASTTERLVQHFHEVFAQAQALCDKLDSLWRDFHRRDNLSHRH